jgi:hypothetical protein
LSLLLAAAQAVMSVPATPAPAIPPVTSSYSIVVARAVSQSDPIPIACGAANCTSWFLGKFDHARTLAGAPLPAEFLARIEMGSPFISQYRLLLLIAPDADGKPRVRSAGGFHTLTNEGCLDARDTSALSPAPAGPGLFRRGRAICTIDR